MADGKVVLHFEIRDDGSLRVLNQAGKELDKLDSAAHITQAGVSKSLAAITEGANG